MCEPVVRWAVKMGFGHKQFTRLLKPIFLKEAEKLLAQQGRTLSDSALSLAAGLHRADVQKWQQHGPDMESALIELDNAISLGDQVLANWTMAKLPASIPYRSRQTDNPTRISGKQPPVSFCDLIELTPKVASHGFSAHLLLQDMISRGLITEDKGQINLNTQATTTSGMQAADRAMQHLCAAQQDLLATGLRNIQSPAEHRFLEESIEIDGLHTRSVTTFHDEAHQQWRAALSKLLPLGRQLSDQDEPQGGQQRLRLGIYFYSEEGPVAPVHKDASPVADTAMDARLRGHDKALLTPAPIPSCPAPIPSCPAPIPSCPAPTGHPSPTDPRLSHTQPGTPPP